MKKVIKRMSLWVLLTVLLLSMGGVASAGTSTVTYTGNTGDIIFGPDGEEHPGDLFTNFKDVMPGDSLTQIIKVKNNADNQVKIQLYLRSLGADSEEDRKILDQLQLTVETVEETPFFDAAASETDGLSEWQMLGVLYSGGETELKVTLTVPVELDNRFQNLAGKLTWQFGMVESPAEEKLWVCPNCGHSRYIIKEKDGVSTYVCQKCGHTEPRICETCGGKMHRVITKDTGHKRWYYYECLHNKDHHTEPAPYTGDHNSLLLWSILAGVGLAGCVFFLILLIRKRRKEEECHEE